MFSGISGGKLNSRKEVFELYYCNSGLFAYIWLWVFSPEVYKDRWDCIYYQHVRLIHPDTFSLLVDRLKKEYATEQICLKASEIGN